MNDFVTIEEVQLYTTQWVWIYNNERPSMALGGITQAMKLAETFKLKDSTADYCYKWEDHLNKALNSQILCKKIRGQGFFSDNSKT